jgi:hypothetical protein
MLVDKEHFQAGQGAGGSAAHKKEEGWEKLKGYK